MTILEETINSFEEHLKNQIILGIESEYGFSWLHKESRIWVGKTTLPFITLSLNYVDKGDDNYVCTCIHSKINLNISFDVVRFYGKLYKLTADFLNGVSDTDDEITWKDIYGESLDTDPVDTEGHNISTLNLTDGTKVVRLVVIEEKNENV